MDLHQIKAINSMDSYLLTTLLHPELKLNMPKGKQLLLKFRWLKTVQQALCCAFYAEQACGVDPGWKWNNQSLIFVTWKCYVLNTSVVEKQEWMQIYLPDMHGHHYTRTRASRWECPLLEKILLHHSSINWSPNSKSSY